MKTLDRLGIAALLAGTAFIAYPALAQDAATGDKPPLIEEEGAASDNSASELAPGNAKSLSGDQSATELAPGQKMQEGEADSAAEAAPGELKKDDTAEAEDPAGSDEDTAEMDDPAAPANENAATDAAPGQKMLKGEADSAAEVAPGELQAEGEVDSAAEAAPGRTDRLQADSEEPGVSGETTASIDLSTDQKAEIRSVIQETEVEPVDIDVDISIGVPVPQTIELHPLPTRIVEIVPEYRDYRYFVLADGRIVIVEPATYEVVYILVV